MKGLSLIAALLAVATPGHSQAAMPRKALVVGIDAHGGGYGA